MAYDEKLATRVRDYLIGRPEFEVVEKKMLGGLAFIVHDKMCINVSDDRLMCRFDPELTEELSSRSGYMPMIMRNRHVKGYCYVEPIGFQRKILKKVFPFNVFRLFIVTLVKVMSLTKNMIHAVWRTKNDAPFIKVPYKKMIVDHIYKYAIEKGIKIDILNGHLNHLHCLYELPPDIALTKSIMYFKGESSHWINEQKIFRSNFQWGKRYFAVSVSPSDCDKVRKYIKYQETHHETYTWTQMVNNFLNWYGIDIERPG